MNSLLESIKNIVGDKGFLCGTDISERPLDWMGKGEREALAIVRPKTTEEVSGILKICNEAKQTVVTVGGLTGLVNGTGSNQNDILLSLERMTEIENIDLLGKTIIVQSGAPLQKVQEFASEKGLQFALDLGARGSCTIGGNIATNAGGNQVLRYGMMREQLLGLEVVLADGTVLNSMNTLLKNNTGYDLKHLFVGSEGTLGVVTRAVLRLHPQALSKNTALVAVDSFDSLTRLFSMVGERLAGGLVAFELMWQEHYDLIAKQSGRHTPPLPSDYKYYIVIEQQGANPEQDLEQFNKVLENAIEKELIVDAVIAQSEAQAQSIWDIREDIEGLVIALMPAAVFDVSLPIKYMDEYTQKIKQQILEKWGEKARTIIFGHLGDGNLHIIVSVGDGSDTAMSEIKNIVYQPLTNIGGSISAEHGIGLDKKDYLSKSRTAAEILMMKKLKQTFDPKNILNPGKIF